MINRRSTPDLLILMIAGTICFALLAAGAAIALVEIRDPGTDTDTAASAILNLLGALVGLVAGYLAGRGRASDRPVMAAPVCENCGNDDATLHLWLCLDCATGLPEPGADDG